MEGSIGLKKCRFSVSTRYAVTFVEGLREFSMACLVQFSSVRNYEGLAARVSNYGRFRVRVPGVSINTFFFCQLPPKLCLQWE